MVLWCNASNWLDTGGRGDEALPNISECYRLSVLVWLPALYLYILFPIFLFQLRRRREFFNYKPLPFTALLIAKLVITIILILDSIFLIAKFFDDVFEDEGAPTNPVYTNRTLIYLTYPLIQALSMSLMLTAICTARRYGIITSGILHTTWFVHLIAGLPQIFAWIVPSPFDYTPLSPARTAASAIWLGCILVQTVLFAFADRRHPDDEARYGLSPEDSASFFNRELYWWFNRLPSVGSRKDIDVDDLFPQTYGSQSSTLVSLWEKYWIPTIEKYNDRKRQIVAESATSSLLGCDYGTLDNGVEIAKKRKLRAKQGGYYNEQKLEPPSVIYNLFKMFKWDFIGAGMIKFFSDVLQFANPLLLKLLIQFVSSDDAPIWKGISLAVLMFVASEIRSLCLSHYFYIMYRMSTKIQTVLTSAVYKKTLRLSNASRHSRTSGEILNLMAIDVERFQMIVSQVQQFWSSPFQIILALIFLFNTLGISAFPGVIVMIIFVPYSIFGSIFAKRFQVRQMTLKDERTKICSEILNGIKVIKLYAWEMPMLEAIERIRKKELLCILKAGIIRIAIDVFNISSPFLVAISSFTTFTLLDPQNNLLTSETAFVSLTLFNQLRSPLVMTGLLIQQTVQVVVSNKRLKEFLVAEEIDQEAVERMLNSKGDGIAISVEDADFSWGNTVASSKPKHLSASTNGELQLALANNATIIQDINLNVSRGQLLAVVGRVGCGKSSLLSAILGEMEKLRGRVVTRGTIAYVSQTPWIRNMSVRENILFGKPYNKQLYNAVLDACALKADLEILTHGDATEIGEKGINLSGGQKARISLARAVYQNSDIYLLDDPLSAVDSHVGKHIFEEVKVIGPKGLLRNKTRVLVTHGVGFLKEVDWIILLDDKRIRESGTYTELLALREKFSQLIEEGKIGSSSSTSESNTSVQNIADLERQTAVETSDARVIEGNDEEQPTSLMEEDECADQIVRKITTISMLDLRERRSQRFSSMLSSSSTFSNSSSSSLAKKRNVVAPTETTEATRSAGKYHESKLIQKELVHTGRVKTSVYKDYMRSAGYLISISYLVLFSTYQGLQIGRNMWLSGWSDDSDKIVHNKTSDRPPMGVNVRLSVYGLFGLFEAISFFVALISLLLGGLSASRNLHSPVLGRIMRAPISFFDTTPSGRILNRLAKDIEVVDMMLVMSFRYFFMCIMQVLSALIVITSTTPTFAIVIIPLGVLYIYILKYYVPTSRQLRRLESINRSPIYSQFGETIHGYSTIRAFLKTNEFCEEIERSLNTLIRIKYQSLVANRWLTIRLEFIGNCVVLFAALFGSLSKEWGIEISAGLIGLSVSYSLNITEVLNFAIRQISELETNIVSVERLKEYASIETEAPWQLDDVQLPKDWPTAGRILFDNYATRYRPGLELVVRNINAEIEPAEKVGIVGRTGAGKSSLTLALFRMIEPAEGRIVIDNVDISKIGLHDLRSNITIIPQDPVLFSGTLRFNLDPFHRYSDSDIWSVLELAHLKTFASSLPRGLEHEISEGGSNISLGQKQLICLARALLRRSKILVLDEATAAVDLTTDALIQETIRREFLKSTVMTIAHRLNTIIDYNRVMVLEKGEIREFDAPQTLLTRDGSVFAAMAADAKLNEAKSS